MVALAPCSRRVRLPGGRRPPPRPCLVISGDAALRRRIQAAAAACGWRCGVVADAADFAAIGCGHGVVFLDLVTLPRGATAATARLAAAGAGARDSRLVVCGAPDSPAEELLARQWGASVYVPGVVPGPGLAALVRALCG